MQYRREIDGLRAVAVLPVILFHAGFSVFSGGFVGVDVFFVISGYLITSILITELERDDFSLVRFYERRARRILPALFVVMFACLPFAYMWMLPSQLKDFAQSLVAVVFFASNILFWREDGYFAAAAELKPLLHTWSLAVEEQYYLLFPLFLLLLWRFGRKRVFWSIAAVAVVSLLLAEWGWRNKPSANFYLAPTRAWELLAGSICAFLTVDRVQRSSNVLSASGLALIVFAVFAFDETTPFPSVYTLVPVVGTALIILFAAEGTWVVRLLSLRGLVGIGLISYSAYLWHQPLFAFARLRSLTEPSQMLMGGLAVTALLLAWATWRYVEQPFRRRRGPLLVTRKGVFATSSAVGAVFIAVGLSGHIGKGFEWRFNDAILDIINVRAGDTSGCHNGLEDTDIEAGLDCRIGLVAVDPKIAIIGDSHASAITDALAELLVKRGLSAATFNGSWCAPLKNFATDFPNKDGCLDEVSASFEQIAQRSDIEVVVLHAEWANYTLGMRWPEVRPAHYIYSASGDFDFSAADVSLNAMYFEMALNSSLSYLTDAGKRVIIVLPVPEHELDVKLFASRAASLEGDASIFGLRTERYEARSGLVREQLIKQGQAYAATIVDPKPVFCDDEICDIVNSSGQALYTDGNHLSFYGASRVAPLIIDAVEDALLRQK